MGKESQNSVLLLNPAAFFHGAVLEAVSDLRAEVTDGAQNYLVNLLTDFINFENLYPTDENGNREETLALQWANALEANNDRERLQKLRKIGDLSLYISGFFASSLNRKAVDMDYYISMGGAAYFEVSQMDNANSSSETFCELSEKFTLCVDVLNEVSDEHCPGLIDDKTLLRLYEQWSKTGSERTARQLAKAGIVIPDEDTKKITKN